ncbi:MULTISPECIES: hypothetical protein [unclassified Caballeronia]|uniref:hypothetical protein n=1 Tax=unclassified Caballeronia TaxID=2646786 RepID=UPI0028674A38|nr:MULTISPECIES: hypothetical protein [unclassified Caballeronia]MDR5753008.1 hypothetical protein [Caballeronia sp. LZ024]MDR5845094.1 hypothetical protein [Caballeronia sp. LZ031]
MSILGKAVSAHSEYRVSARLARKSSAQAAEARAWAAQPTPFLVGEERFSLRRHRPGAIESEVRVECAGRGVAHGSKGNGVLTPSALSFARSSSDKVMSSSVRAIGIHAPIEKASTQYALM